MLETDDVTSAVVLYADDTEAQRYALSRVLRNAGFQVREAVTGRQALEMAAALPDLILLDVNLPDINGIEVSSRIGHAIPGLKILFATQSNHPDVARAALSNGAPGCLLKVDAAAELLPAIEMVLRGERFISKGIKARALR